MKIVAQDIRIEFELEFKSVDEKHALLNALYKSDFNNDVDIVNRTYDHRKPELNSRNHNPKVMRLTMYNQYASKFTKLVEGMNNGK